LDRDLIIAFSRAPQDCFCEAFLFANVIASLNEVKVWQSHGFN